MGEPRRIRTVHIAMRMRERIDLDPAAPSPWVAPETFTLECPPGMLGVLFAFESPEAASELFGEDEPTFALHMSEP